MLRWLILGFVVLVLALSAAQRENLIRDTEFLRDPFYRRQAKNRVAQIADIIERDAAAGRPLPGRLSFPQYLREREDDPARRLDPWGRPYFVKGEGVAIRVASLGRDGKEGTSDDIVSRLIEARP